jgi:hypothetical protein
VQEFFLKYLKVVEKLRRDKAFQSIKGKHRGLVP